MLILNFASFSIRAFNMFANPGMGTEVYCKSQVPGYYSMRDINEDPNSISCSKFYRDKNLLNGQYYNGFIPRAVIDGYPGYEKHVLKQQMLEHEAIFKNQVYELHRVYRVQREMMEEVRRKGQHKHHISIETSSSSSLLPSQIPTDEAKKWHIPSFPLVNSNCVRPSILGSEVTDSPLSCTKRNSSQACQVSYQNKRSSIDCGFSDSRPSKVRKKLFDLQLPADEHIDTEEEQCQDTKISDISSYPPNGNHRVALENSVKLFLGGEKTGCHRDTSSNSCLKSSHGLADLNEPIQVEEDTPHISVDFLGHSACHGEIRGLNFSSKPTSQFIDLSQEFPQNSQHGSSNGNLKNLSVANEGNRRGWLSNMYEAGNSGRNPNCIPKFLQPEQLPISSHSTPFIWDKSHQHPGIFPTDFRREESWTEKSRTYEFSDRSRDSKYNHPDSIVASHISNPYVNYSDVANSWCHSVTSWGQTNASLTQKLTSVNTRPSCISAETLSRSSQPSAQTHEAFGDKWHANGSSRLSPGLGSNLPTGNGFYSLSGSKELPVHLSSTGYDNMNCSKLDTLASEHFSDHGSRNLFEGSDVMDLKSGKDVDLNMVLPKTSFDEADPQQRLEILDGKSKCEDHIAVLPWLREKPVCKTMASITRKDLNLVELGFLQASCNQFLKNETVKDPNLLFAQNVSSASNGHDVVVVRESDDRLGNGKMVGYPVFGKLYTSKNDSSSLVSTSASTKNEGKHRGIDINVACDLMDADSGKEIPAEALVMEKGMDTKFKNLRNIDLNSCISEDEDLLGSSLTSTSARVTIALDIDLEAPVVLESEEAILHREEHNQREAPLQSPQHKAEHPGDDVIRIAAEAIVAISLCGQDHHMECNYFDPSGASLPDSLLWFAEVISSSAENLESMLCKGLRGRGRGEIEISEELDYFEAMTLQLKETREEDCMPKPFVPEVQEMEEIGTTSLPRRTRKGRARRGRQRRDFQRDILPGLVSLSRHEVTEDLQTFGGLMRATGHQWNGGLTRRNGSRSGATRGRRRCVVDPGPCVPVTPVCTPLMQQLNSVEVGLEDRSLTGWGRTTRRPRRQRCASGNNLSVALT